VELRAWPRDTWAKGWDVWMQHENGSGGRWRLWTVQETVAR
jgi:hypothetical protein